jgi:outer membrane PBP1 activator LpoA protein
VSILAFIGGCAPTSTLQNKPQSENETLSTPLALPNQQLPASAEIDQLSDLEKLLQAEELLATENTEDSVALIIRINPDNLDNRSFVRHSILMTNIYIANAQFELASGIIETPRFNALVGQAKI